MARFRKKPKPRTVPTEEDWGNCQSDLDQEYAHRLFAGRTNAEIQCHFRSNVIGRTEDLQWMPEIPFRYYMLGFRDFLIAGDFGDKFASNAASCFLHLVAEKLENHPRHIMPIMPELLPTIEHVARNQAVFEADEHIYGNFLEQWKRIQQLFEDRGGIAYSNQLNEFL
jgi:hypothetical protein